eukprot:1781986-Amphidinium_carterae.1
MMSKLIAEDVSEFKNLSDWLARPDTQSAFDSPEEAANKVIQLLRKLLNDSMMADDLALSYNLVLVSLAYQDILSAKRSDLR